MLTLKYVRNTTSIVTSETVLVIDKKLIEDFIKEYKITSFFMNDEQFNFTPEDIYQAIVTDEIYEIDCAREDVDWRTDMYQLFMEYCWTVCKKRGKTEILEEEERDSEDEIIPEVELDGKNQIE